MIRTVTELMKLESFKERYEYLRIGGSVGSETFGVERYLNQVFYKSDEWKRVRDYVILRDNGCDLAVPNRDIHYGLLIHHINPITMYDIVNKTKFLLDPEFLITTCLNTHNAIHYGSFEQIASEIVERRPFDTCPWKGV